MFAGIDSTVEEWMNDCEFDWGFLPQISLMVNLEVRRLSVIVAPGRKVIIALGGTTVGLDLHTAHLTHRIKS